MQTEGKMQTKTNSLWLWSWPDCEAQEQSVECLEASDTEHQFQDHAYLHSRWSQGEKK